MTETTDPTPNTTPAAPIESGGKAPRKRAASKRAASKDPAPAPEAEKSAKDVRSLYLPALPEGFDYTGITATGPTGQTITISPDAKGAHGAATLNFEGAGLNREQSYPTMKDAITAGGKAAKAMAKIAEREAELAKVREEAFDL